MTPTMCSAVIDAMLEGAGLFDVAERFGVSPSEIIASTESEILRRHLAEVRQQIVDHRKARQPRGQRRPKRKETLSEMPSSRREKLIEMSLRWQRNRGLA